MAGIVVGSVAGAGLTLLIQRLSKLRKGGKGDGEIQERSTTSSAGGGAAAYETKKAVDEYLQFHFAAPTDLLPYANGPKEALNFTTRLAQLCERHCEALRDFTGERGDAVALDLGCAVGGAAFELARAFPHVLGIDYSHHFVDAANYMKDKGFCEYEAVVEGDIKATCMAAVPADIDRTRVRFMQGDACALPADLAQLDCVLAANLLCRLPEPMAFINRCRSLIKPGGVLVLVSPYSWLKGWTDKSKWLGGYYKDGKPVRTYDTICAALSPDFELVASSDVPFLIREHARKFQWGCSNALVWKRKGRTA
ncbi:hypothetical protein HYH02_004081 [Chlamydomonas schloesseri]|uniref:Methyltransferase type 11 domain-containing protein n=1 Tax=Chlamydomonas schloesseri TaxID=2026947 RepID=A0A835WP74_9CHLO|nr:hypothetical protein HYH02_004081 [Chlamydomonas schloesseri]|eukprot:KAG2451483.1 hypothetical protein HYH02_004081 [Chlamydomonas schloesseri]